MISVLPMASAVAQSYFGTKVGETIIAAAKKLGNKLKNSSISWWTASAEEKEGHEIWYMQPGDKWLKNPELRVNRNKVYCSSLEGYDISISRHVCVDIQFLAEYEARNLIKLYKEEEAERSQSKDKEKISSNDLKKESTINNLPQTVSVYCLAPKLSKNGVLSGSVTQLLLKPSSMFQDLDITFPVNLLPKLEPLTMNKNDKNMTTNTQSWYLQKKIKDVKGKKSKFILSNKDIQLYYTMKYFSGHPGYEIDDNVSNDLPSYEEPKSVSSKLSFIGYLPSETMSNGFFGSDDDGDGDDDDDNNGGVSGQKKGKKFVYDTMVFHSKFSVENGCFLYDLSLNAGVKDEDSEMNATLDYDKIEKNWNGIFGTLSTLNTRNQIKNKYKYSGKELAEMALNSPDGNKILRKKYPYMVGINKTKYVTLSFAHNNKPQGIFQDTAIQFQGSKFLPNQTNLNNKRNGQRHGYYMSFPSKSQIMVHILKPVENTSLYSSCKNGVKGYYVSDVYLFVKPGLHNIRPVLKGDNFFNQKVNRKRKLTERGGNKAIKGKFNTSFNKMWTSDQKEDEEKKRLLLSSSTTGCGNTSSSSCTAWKSGRLDTTDKEIGSCHESSSTSISKSKLNWLMEMFKSCFNGRLKDSFQFHLHKNLKNVHGKDFIQVTDDVKPVGSKQKLSLIESPFNANSICNQNSIVAYQGECFGSGGGCNGGGQKENCSYNMNNVDSHIYCRDTAKYFDCMAKNIADDACLDLLCGNSKQMIGAIMKQTNDYDGQTIISPSMLKKIKKAIGYGKKLLKKGGGILGKKKKGVVGVETKTSGTNVNTVILPTPSSPPSSFSSKGHSLKLGRTGYEISIRKNKLPTNNSGVINQPNAENEARTRTQNQNGGQNEGENESTSATTTTTTTMTSSANGPSSGSQSITMKRTNATTTTTTLPASSFKTSNSPKAATSLSKLKKFTRALSNAALKVKKTINRKNEKKRQIYNQKLKDHHLRTLQKTLKYQQKQNKRMTKLLTKKYNKQLQKQQPSLSRGLIIPPQRPTQQLPANAPSNATTTATTITPTPTPTIDDSNPSNNNQQEDIQQAPSPNNNNNNNNNSENSNNTAEEKEVINQDSKDTSELPSISKNNDNDNDNNDNTSGTLSNNDNNKDVIANDKPENEEKPTSVTDQQIQDEVNAKMKRTEKKQKYKKKIKKSEKKVKKAQKKLDKKIDKKARKSQNNDNTAASTTNGNDNTVTTTVNGDVDDRGEGGDDNSGNTTQSVNTTNGMSKKDQKRNEKIEKLKKQVEKHQGKIQKNQGKRENMKKNNNNNNNNVNNNNNNNNNNDNDNDDKPNAMVGGKHWIKQYSMITQLPACMVCGNPSMYGCINCGNSHYCTLQHQTHYFNMNGWFCPEGLQGSLLAQEIKRNNS